MIKLNNNIILIFLLLASALFNSCERKQISTEEKGLTVSDALSGGKDSGFTKAIKSKEFVFPGDNGPHRDFRTEWWYFTGNLSSREGKKFGYQLTFFRNALNPFKFVRDSDWAFNQVYMGHFALTDIDGNKFYFFERFSRDGNNLAGAEASPFNIWIENWAATETGESLIRDFPDVKLLASEKDISLQLFLKPEKPIVLQGDDGLSRKGKEEGNASYYYSVSRLKSEGSLALLGELFVVSGYSWLDREWSTTTLDSGQKGWDWFSLQMDNGYDFMYYRLRNKDGSDGIFSKGVLINADGVKENIGNEDIRIEITDEWKNNDGKMYPSGWRFSIPDKNIYLKILPSVKNQELKVTVKYWEGSVMVEGTFNGKKINGMGYAELTGYAE